MAEACRENLSSTQVATGFARVGVELVRELPLQFIRQLVVVGGQ